MEVGEYPERVYKVAEDILATEDMEKLHRLVHTVMDMASRLDLDIEFTNSTLKVIDHVPP